LVLARVKNFTHLTLRTSALLVIANTTHWVGMKVFEGSFSISKLGKPQLFSGFALLVSTVHKDIVLILNCWASLLYELFQFQNAIVETSL
ncbi:MAG TPA: hypothetical protein V6C91_03375, partial [Coleofasciculaceae cyanobacterium]